MKIQISVEELLQVVRALSDTNAVPSPPKDNGASAYKDCLYDIQSRAMEALLSAFGNDEDDEDEDGGEPPEILLYTSPASSARPGVVSYEKEIRPLGNLVVVRESDGNEVIKLDSEVTADEHVVGLFRGESQYEPPDVDTEEGVDLQSMWVVDPHQYKVPTTVPTTENTELWEPSVAGHSVLEYSENERPSENSEKLGFRHGSPARVVISFPESGDEVRVEKAENAENRKRKRPKK